MRTRFVRPIVSLLMVLGVVSALGMVPEVAEGRCKAPVASAISTARSVVPVATACIDTSSVLLLPSTPRGGGPVCDSAAITDEWPLLQAGYEYRVVEKHGAGFRYDLILEKCQETFLSCTLSGCEHQETTCKPPHSSSRDIAAPSTLVLAVLTSTLVALFVMVVTNFLAYQAERMLYRLRGKAYPFGRFTWKKIQWPTLVVLACVCVLLVLVVLAGLGC